MANKEGIEITVMMPMTENEKNIFGLSNNVHIINTIDYEKNNFSTFCFRLLRKINQKTLIITRLNLKKVLRKFVLLPGLEKRYVSVLASSFDVVIGVGCWYSLLLAYISPKIVNTITVGWMHSTYESYFNNPNSLSYGYENVFSEIAKNLNEIFVLTKSDKTKFDSEIGINSRVLYNPVDETFFVGGRKYKKRHRLLFVGRISMQHKGVDFLIPIMKKVLRKYSDVELTVVGDGPDKDNFQKLVFENKLEEKIRLVGQSSDVKQYYLESDILLVPSRWEGFGVVLIEAMACGTPVIAYENKGPNEIIKNNVNGILIKPYEIDEFSNEIIKLLDDAKRWEKLSEQAYRRACDFSTQKTIECFMEYIKNHKEE